MTVLKLNITGDKLCLGTSRLSFNSGSKGYYIAEFTFNSDWDGLIPHITITENGTVRADEIIIDNTHKVPTTESGIMQIGVYGLDSDGKKCISTNLICIEVRQGAYTGVEPLPKDIWDGYQVIVLGYMERAEKAAADAIAAEKNINNLSATASEGDTVSVSKTITEEGIKLDFTIPRGSKGDTGPQGPIGPKGERGYDGMPGVPGIDGYTPVKGVDYFTNKDIEDLFARLNIDIMEIRVKDLEDIVLLKANTTYVDEKTTALEEKINFHGLAIDSINDEKLQLMRDVARKADITYVDESIQSAILDSWEAAV